MAATRDQSGLSVRDTFSTVAGVARRWNVVNAGLNVQSRLEAGWG